MVGALEVKALVPSDGVHFKLVMLMQHDSFSQGL